MSLLKRRSRSETRRLKYLEQSGSVHEGPLRKIKNVPAPQNQMHLSNIGQRNQMDATTVKGLGRKKTSAELISEAKILLGDPLGSSPNIAVNHAASVGGGVRVVSTRRPITPRETGRALYGKVALPGRPPSAFSLRYLQNEGGNRTPMTSSLEPIKQPKGSLEVVMHNSEHLHTQRTSRRSNSLDSRGEFYRIGGDIEPNMRSIVQTKGIPRKLPALEVKGVTIGSIQTCVVPLKQCFILKHELIPAETHKTRHGISRERNKTTKPSLEPSHLQEESTTAINLLTSRKLLARNYDILAQSTTEKLIELLKEHAGLKDCTEETTNHVNTILVELYGRVRKNEKHFKRGFILGGLYGLVECTSPKILLAVARVVLALHVSGSNLTGACKLIFKVARNEQNDYLFHDNDLLELLIDGLGRASPLDDPEACIYGYGSIRFLTSSTGQERADASAIKDANKNWSECLELPRKPATAPAPSTNNTYAFEQLLKDRFQKLSKQNSLVERLARHGAVQLMVLHLQILNEVGATENLSGSPLHSLYQLSAALRALADVRQTSCSIELEDPNQLRVQPKRANNESIQLELACPQLVRAAEVSIGELEVQANIVRTLSVLSEDSNCCHVLVNFTARIGMLLGPCCEIFNDSPDKLLSLFSRLGYILGNIMAKYDNARVQFYHNDVAMEYLLNVLEICSKKPLSLQNSLGDTVIDVLIKMIRVVANMSVNSEVGFGLGHTRDLGALLLNLLKSSSQMKTTKMKTELKELMHATLGALHNLCFYQDKNVTPTQVIESKGSLQSVLPDLATALCFTLRNSTEQATQVETARVLGNLTRNEQARNFFCRAGGLPLILQHLSHNTYQEYDLKACAIGVLVNLLGDWENRAPFIQLKGAELILGLLKLALQEGDYFLASIICQAFWNLLIDTLPNVTVQCEERVLDEICDLLADYLDEELLFEGRVDADVLWEEFAVVATDLLERIQSSYDKQSQDPFSVEASGEENDDEDDVYIEEM